MLGGGVFDGRQQALWVAQHAAVQGCSRRSRQQQIVFGANDLRGNWLRSTRGEQKGASEGSGLGFDGKMVGV